MNRRQASVTSVETDDDIFEGFEVCNSFDSGKVIQGGFGHAEGITKLESRYS